MICETCNTQFCDKCKKPRDGEPLIRLAPPIGSLNERMATIVCRECYNDFVVMTFEWFGRTVHPDLIKI